MVTGPLVTDQLPATTVQGGTVEEDAAGLASRFLVWHQAPPTFAEVGVCRKSKKIAATPANKTAFIFLGVIQCQNFSMSICVCILYLRLAHSDAGTFVCIAEGVGRALENQSRQELVCSMRALRETSCSRKKADAMDSWQNIFINLSGSEATFSIL
jgi:hypothetical protein